MNFSPQVIVVIILVVIFEVVWLIKTYNSLLRRRQALYETQSNLMASLEKRYVAVSRVQQAAAVFNEREQKLQGMVARIRSGDFESAKELSTAVVSAERLTNFLVVKVEGNPKLVSADLNSTLMKTLVDTEYAILGSRLLYNRAAAQFLDMYRTFPQSLVAKAFGFAQPEFFSADLLHSVSSASNAQFSVSSDQVDPITL